MTYIQLGAEECVAGLNSWRISHVFGTAELRRRYSRSRLGQGWLTLSMAATATLLALVWTVLWRAPAAIVLPHVIIGIVLWNFISAIITDATHLSQSVTQIIFNQHVAFSTFAYAVIYRNLIVFAHNSIIIVVVMAVFPVFKLAELPLFLPAVALTSVCGFFVALITAMVCARFRDLQHVVASALQFGFYVTPVLWLPEALPSDYQWILKVNPFTCFLEILRGPLLGAAPSAMSWVASAGLTIVVGLLALYLTGRWRNRLVYWL